MKYNAAQKNIIRDTLSIILMSTGIAVLYPVFADELTNPLPFLNSLFIGLAGGLFISLLELKIFRNTGNYSFLAVFMIKTLLYFSFLALLIPLVKGFNESIYYQQNFLTYIKSERFLHFIFDEDYIIILVYALFFIALILFTRMMGKKLGKTILLNFITGKYHEPHEVERIFMYLDLRSSTTIAEKLGPSDYHLFLKDFFQDVDDCILTSRGSIYRYVADQVVVTWDMRKGLKDASCIATYFALLQKLETRTSYYFRKYGIVPQFSSTFHSGKVVVGEIGDVKSQIVYLGEVLHQTAEIEKKRAELSESLLLSETLIRQFTFPLKYEILEIANIEGLNHKELKLYTLAR